MLSETVGDLVDEPEGSCRVGREQSLRGELGIDGFACSTGRLPQPAMQVGHALGVVVSLGHHVGRPTPNLELGFEEPERAWG